MNFKQISKVIDNRIIRYSEDSRVITEDCIRYDIFCSLLDNHKSSDFILEHPHDFYTGKEIDLVIINSGDKSIFEIKYYRKIPSKKEDRTSRMAKIFVDVLKLNKSNISENKYFIFLSDEVMINYIKNNGYSYLIQNKSINIELTEEHKKSKHFTKILKSNLNITQEDIKNININLSLVFSKELSNNHHLYIYKII